MKTLIRILIILLSTNYAFAQKSLVKEYTIEQFMNTTSIFGSSFSPKEDKLLFSSNKNGIFNAFTIDLKSKQEQMLTSSTEDYAMIISYFPSDERVLFRRDQSGNERSHIYARELDGSIVDLTPDSEPRTFASFSGWRQQDGKDYLYFTSNKRNPRFQDLYRIDVSTDKKYTPELVYQNDRGFAINAMSSDGRLLALTTFIDRKEILMHYYDMDKGQVKDLHNAKALFTPQFFSADGSELYYLTDRDHEFMYLERINLNTEERVIVEQYDWDISFSTISDKEKYRVTAVNADGRMEMKLFEHQTSKTVAIPEMPEGDITSLVISPSEKQMAFYVNGSKSPSDLYIYNFDNKNQEKLTNSLSADINADDLVQSEIVRYKTFDGLDIPGILYKPKQIEGVEYPAIVYVHGGPGGQSRDVYTPRIQYWVNHGYVVFAVNHRGSSGYGKTFSGLDDRRHGRDDLDDLVYAKQYLSSLPYVDGDKIAIWGGSYGGYLVMAALTFRPEEFTIGVDYFGVTDLIRTFSAIPASMVAMRRSMIGEIGDPVKDSVMLANKSPIHFVDRIKRPFMVLQGAQDPRVLKRESDSIVEAGRANGITVEYIVFQDEGHGFLKKQNRITATEAVLKFMDEHLKGIKPKN